MDGMPVDREEIIGSLAGSHERGVRAAVLFVSSLRLFVGSSRNIVVAAVENESTSCLGPCVQFSIIVGIKVGFCFWA